MRIPLHLLLLIAPIFFQPSVVHAETKEVVDVKGSKDHPLVGRYEGSKIIQYVSKAYDERLFINRQLNVSNDAKKSAENSEKVSGKFWRIVYLEPVGRSATEVIRNVENGLKRKGFTSVYSCKSAECYGPRTNKNGLNSLLSEDDDRVYLFSDTASEVYSLNKLSRPEGDVWVSLQGGQELGHPNAKLVADIVESAPMEKDKIVFIDASEMEKSINVTGRVALYGILFDFDKADIKPESTPTLDEVAKYLKANPTTNLIVTGHTDAKGEFDYNVQLSKRRANAVVDMLTSKYKIAANRLTGFGAGMSSPVASNDTEEGKAKNRRVELVKRQMSVNVPGLP